LRGTTERSGDRLTCGPVLQGEDACRSVAGESADTWAIPVSEGAGERRHALGKVVEWLTGGLAVSVKGGRGSD
jgi:hypothetical protein